ncbi:serine/threonine-protein phosphatase 6 regulatory subunit 3-like isoform X2 [Chenopodium quinoa]|uniref:serine/threonine-protein phosphatase 6 regulatory subunit 3-like isoform X2 n=1 Tax=Chenopodium quinoa TaxID=63459 RepID=UPI000B78B376|nr:serine/threonine-protein phosphatase 6 regulatory subunit 3-like isoform X2 [Chenopodium quinoa]
MFWRMAGLSTASPVETILDKDNFTLDELLDEDEIIQECKALNARLINFLRERPQVEQLIRYIVEEAPEDAERQRNFKFPFISCEIFTCEVDIILKTLVEDEELMNLLFSFLDREHSHSTLLAGYFSKVVICLLMRKTVSLMEYIQAHQEIIRQLVDLIGITSIMEVLVRLIGADEHIYANYAEAMRWLEDTDVLEMIVDKFSSSDSPEVHANAAETLCAITRYAPPGISAKITSSRLIGRLFHNALEESRPKSVLFNSLSVCISLLDPKRLTFGTYYAYNRQFSQGPSIAANHETVDGMLGSLGSLLKLLDVSSDDSFLLTTYGKLQPPLGKQRLKIIEFILVLLSSGNEAAEKEVIRLGAVKRILDMFFEYPYNNFLHHHVENVILSCFESKSSILVEHLLNDCDLVGKTLEAEKSPLLSSDSSKPTVCMDGRDPPRVGNIGHLTRISNKLVHLSNTNSDIQAFFQDNTEWLDWCSNVLSKRNAVENVYQWVCGRPTALQDRTRDSDDDDYQDRDYDVAALANNLSQAFHYGIYSNELEEVQASLERDEEDVYFDDESAEVVISSLRLGDDQESGSLFTNSNWFAFEDDRVNNERLTDTLASPSPADEEPGAVSRSSDDLDANDDMDTATSQVPEVESITNEPIALPAKEEVGRGATSEQNDWVEWRETSNSSDLSDEADKQEEIPKNFEELGNKVEEDCPSAPELSSSTVDGLESNGVTQDVGVQQLSGETGVAENIGEPLSSSSSNSSQDEVKLPEAEQISNPDGHEEPGLAQAGN